MRDQGGKPLSGLQEGVPYAMPRQERDCKIHPVGVDKKIRCGHSGSSAGHLIPSFLIFRHRVDLLILSSRAVACLL